MSDAMKTLKELTKGCTKTGAPGQQPDSRFLLKDEDAMVEKSGMQ